MWDSGWGVLFAVIGLLSAQIALAAEVLVSPGPAPGGIQESSPPAPWGEVPPDVQQPPAVESRPGTKDLKQSAIEGDREAEGKSKKKTKNRKKVWFLLRVGGGALFYAQTLVSQYNSILSLVSLNSRFPVGNSIEILVDAYGSFTTWMSTRPSAATQWFGGRLGIAYTPFPSFPAPLSFEIDETASLLQVTNQSFGYNMVYRAGFGSRLMFGLGKGWWTSMFGHWAPVTGTQVSQSDVSGGISLYYLWPKRQNGWVLSFDYSHLAFTTKSQAAVEQIAMIGSLGYLF